MIRLRPIRPADDEFLTELDHPDVAGPFNTFPPDERATPEWWVERRVIELENGTPIGSMSWHPVSYGPNRKSTAVNLGITIHPEWRGRGLGAAAQRALADLLFATGDVNRVEASTDVENVAEQRALERAGFRREGIARGAQFRQGAWHDLVVYSRLRLDE